MLPGLRGALLDVGCGEKPYAKWTTGITCYVGIDTVSRGADVLVGNHEEWPFADNTFDAVLCTQVMEHVDDVGRLLSEITRVLKPGGNLVLTVPFAYNEHDAPRDFWRFSAHGARRLLEQGYDIDVLKSQGAIGSTCGLLCLNWIDASLGQTRVGRFLKGVMLPVWIVVSLVINLIGSFVDYLDRTDSFYSNVLVIARRR
ncbi:MAG: hypothetical protein A2151_03005 [Candidatus Muproteobacteria bacterium RBG_16_65_34]|uniref:Methyltransferase type 11 domain-containing protein n=1 Tax=Candidatus Muproteobacteria bacterium RBG_16_65_34 TaxID=1817760 RepID=A0A1F6TRM8_9PROT|nr:MAG: hypothetical protein A2151_03005 [Candidatus Muproteobacteria bacterium RBG_16_65_34]